MKKKKPTKAQKAEAVQGLKDRIEQASVRGYFEDNAWHELKDGEFDCNFNQDYENPKEFTIAIHEVVDCKTEDEYSAYCIFKSGKENWIENNY